MPLIPLGLFTAFLWGVTPVLQKYVLSTLSPFIVLFIQTICVTIFTTIYICVNPEVLKQGFPRITVKSFGIILLISLIMTAATIFYIHLLSSYDSSIVTALTYSSPFFTLILAFIFLREELQAISLVGIVLVVTGIWCLALGNKK